MPLESSIQSRGTAALEVRGCIVYRGSPVEGWPDSLVIWAPGRHFWIEWKKDKGATYTRAQMVRIPWLEKRGEKVYRCDTVNEALEALAVERIKG